MDGVSASTATGPRRSRGTTPEAEPTAVISPLSTAWVKAVPPSVPPSVPGPVNSAGTAPVVTTVPPAAANSASRPASRWSSTVTPGRMTLRNVPPATRHVSPSVWPAARAASSKIS